MPGSAISLADLRPATLVQNRLLYAALSMLTFAMIMCSRSSIRARLPGAAVHALWLNSSTGLCKTIASIRSRSSTRARLSGAAVHALWLNSSTGLCKTIASIRSRSSTRSRLPGAAVHALWLNSSTGLSKTIASINQ
jgi:hypothetical protein